MIALYLIDGVGAVTYVTDGIIILKYSLIMLLWQAEHIICYSTIFTLIS